MSVSLSRRSLGRLSRPCSSRSMSTMGYVPHQATHFIDPVEIRSKPPPQFFTGNPNFYVAMETLERTLIDTQDRLRLARCFPLTPDHPKQPKDDFEWRTQEEIELLMGIPNIRGLEFKRFTRVLDRLVRVRHAAEVATDLKSAQRITDLLSPFQIINPAKDAAAAIIAGVMRRRAPDAQGRTRTTGTRKKARAEVWMQYTPALAAVFHNPQEKQRLAERAREVENNKVADVAKAAAIKVAGAKSLGPVFAQIDHAAAQKALQKKRAGLDPGPSTPLVVAPIEKIWQAEVEKRERVERLAREMLKERQRKATAVAALGRPSSSSANSSSSAETGASTSTSTSDGDDAALTPEEERALYLASDRAKLPSSPDYHLYEPASRPTPLSTDPASAFLPPTQYQTYQSLISADLSRLSELRSSRSTTLVPSNSNSPVRDPAQPKDGTIVVNNTTTVEKGSDPTVGQVLVNGVPIHRFFPDPKDRETILRPLKVARLLGAFNIFALVHRGGQMGSAEAMSLAIAKGVAIHQPTAKQALARDGLLGVDHRQVERKKTGMVKARKQEKWVKR